MNNILTKPYTNEQYAEFANDCNKNNQRIEFYNGDAYALYEYEKLEKGEVIDLKESQEYQKEQRLKEIDTELAQIEENFKTYMDTPVLYPVNGKLYKPKWADDGTYLKVLQSFELLSALGVENPSMTIWDATELEENVVTMNKIDLVQLTTWLYQQAQPVYEQKKQAVSELKKEKEELLNENTTDN